MDTEVSPIVVIPITIAVWFVKLRAPKKSDTLSATMLIKIAAPNNDVGIGAS
jgi:hypothetical protein